MTEEKKDFQEFKSAKNSTRLTTPTGKKITFLDYTFITSDPEVIDYLVAEIKGGLNLISVGEVLSSAEIDPMARLKEKVIAEYEEAKQKTAKDELEGKSRNMGSTTQSPTKISPASSKAVAASSK